jgi:2'-5' RNA ligase
MTDGVGAAKGSRMRLFFAVLPDLITRDRIAVAAAAAAAAAFESLPAGATARAVAHANYHVTVAFVGEVAGSQVPILRAIGGAQRIRRFALRFDAYEYWPKPEVMVAAARVVPEELKRLWQQLHQELAVHQWALAAKRLRPHVTLARKLSQAPLLPAMPAFDWPVREFCLMRSDTSGPESAYTVIDTWPLLDKTDEG